MREGDVQLKAGGLTSSSSKKNSNYNVTITKQAVQFVVKGKSSSKQF